MEHRAKKPQASRPQTPPARDPVWNRFPLLSAFLLASLVYVVSLRAYHWLPAYHDAALHWETAQAFFLRPLFPFVVEHDTGHPPLVSWLLSVMWHLPLPRLLSMHLLGWAAAGLLCAALFDLTRRTLGLLPGLCVAAIVGLHPVVLAQSLQLNLDLFQIAFAWTAVAAMVAGRPWLVALALTASSLTKLNGPFAVPPVALWILLQLYREQRLLDVRRLMSALWPVAVPTAAFVVYHVLKYFLTGHFLVGPDFRDENLGYVTSLADYLSRLSHSLNQLCGFGNPNLLTLILIGVLLVVVLVRSRSQAFSALRTSQLSATAPQGMEPPVRKKRHESAAHFFRPLSVQQTVELSWLVAVCHILFWTIRQYFGLVRHMMGAYPALALSVVLLAVLAFPSRKRLALAVVMVPILTLTYLATHSSRVRFLPKSIAERLYFPPTGIQTNHENSLELVDELDLARRAIADIERRFGPNVTIETRWPFQFFFKDPSFGMSKTAFQVVPSGADVIFVPGCTIDGPESEVLKAPPGYAVSAIHRSGRILDVTFVRKAAPVP